MKKTGIYKIENLETKQVYIGATKNIDKRFIQHRSALKRNDHDNHALQDSWNLYGEKSFSFEIIEECSIEELDEKEIFWIAFYGGYESTDLFNLRDGGKAGKWAAEIIEKIRLNNLGHPCFWKGKHLPEEIKQKISQSNLGKKRSAEARKRISENNHWRGKPGYWHTHQMSDEHRKKLSLAHKGQKSWNKGQRGMISEETRQKLIISHLGQKHSDETRAKMSRSHKGKIFSEETRRKLSLANKGQRRNWMTKDGINTSVPPEKIQEYIANGWRLGYDTKGAFWITNGTENKKVTQEQFDLLDKTIWRRGRSLGTAFWVTNGIKNRRVTPETYEQLNKKIWKKGRILNKIWITNGTENKMIPEEKYIEFNQTIWKRGKTHKK